MRWLFLKDLQILRRSPLVTALLVIYPVVIAVLIGFALSRGPEKPRVAFLNEVPSDERFDLGGEREHLEVGGQAPSSARGSSASTSPARPRPGRWSSTATCWRP